MYHITFFLDIGDSQYMGGFFDEAGFQTIRYSLYLGGCEDVIMCFIKGHNKLEFLYELSQGFLYLGVNYSKSKLNLF